jgi:WNK lysine deficient protein kinase
MKCVYRGFDEERGMEVAWNQASLCDVLRTPDAVQRMYSEVQLLRTLRHESVIAFHASWVDVPRRTFNFITELFSSGTLRSYRLRYPRVSLRAVRSWARQILRGLGYLHAHGVIHRDLKCDNLLVNGHLGQVKIADLGLAAVLFRGARRARSVIGTPEFMAPEMYDEEYDELVDVYSFGMCMLEMLTLEFPYAECSNPAQIYKKVTAGKRPDAFYRVKDDGARRFIGRCLLSASERPSAAELLLDPFLLDDPSSMISPRPPLPLTSSNNVGDDDTLSDHQDEPPAVATRSDMMTITGKPNAEEDTIFLKVQITDESGPVRNIYFPFDTASDTAMEVATEMVKELDITDRDPSEIAAMIEQEIDRLLPHREQHEYSYENEEHPPPPLFYYLSSSPTSSSQGSLYGVGSSSSGGFCHPHGGGWSKGKHTYMLACFPPKKRLKLIVKNAIMANKLCFYLL